MHELSIALNIVDGVLEEVKRMGGPQVEVVHLRVGRLSGVVKEALEFSYGLACEETPLAGSRLAIEVVDVLILCPVCGGERPTQSFPMLICGECGSMAQRVVRGDELEITGLEVTS